MNEKFTIYKGTIYLTFASLLQSIADDEFCWPAGNIHVIIVKFRIEKIELAIILDNECDQSASVLKHD